MSAKGFDPDQSNFFSPRGAGEIPLVFDDKLIACEACGSAEFRPFATDWQGVRIVSCRSCGLRFVNPRPSFGTLAKRSFQERLSTAESAPGSRLSVSGEEQAFVESCRRRYRSQMEQLEARVPPRPHSLLEVDCGDGAFLHYAGDRGWQVVATNISERGAQLLGVGQGFQAYRGRLHEIDFSAPSRSVGPHRFSAIRLDGVLDRSHHPAHDLQVCRRILQPNGILLLTVANVASLDGRIKTLTSRVRLKARAWKHYAGGQHLFFFTADTLDRLLDRCGFEILHRQTPVVPKGGRSHVVHQIYRAFLEIPGWASTLEVYARPA